VGALCNHSLELTGVVGDPGSSVHRLDPRAKIVICTAVTVVAVSAPLALWPVYVGCALTLAIMAAIGRVPVSQLWRRARWVVPLVLIVGVFLPLVRTGGQAWELGPLTIHEAGLAVFAQVAAKTLIGVSSAVVLTSTTSFPDVIAGLEAMRLPKVLVLIASLMYRYMYVIVEDVGRMRSALTARAYRPRHALQAGAIGKVAGALFLRSYERGERVHLAMLARGYRNRMPRLVPLELEPRDAVVLTAIPAMLIALRVIAEVGR
jgi:cobalt/nickel transport system permease protein